MDFCFYNVFEWKFVSSSQCSTKDGSTTSPQYIDVHKTHRTKRKKGNKKYIPLWMGEYVQYICTCNIFFIVFWNRSQGVPWWESRTPKWHVHSRVLDQTRARDVLLWAACITWVTVTGCRDWLLSQLSGDKDKKVLAKHSLLFYHVCFLKLEDACWAVWSSMTRQASAVDPVYQAGPAQSADTFCQDITS